MDLTLNGLTLAYIGDAYFELKIRTYLVAQGYNKVDVLHKKAIKYTSGQAQSNIVAYFIESNMLTEEEIDLYKRGRNASGPGRKNIDAKVYHQATGFEALIGDLYLNNIERANELISIAIQYIEKGEK